MTSCTSGTDDQVASYPALNVVSYPALNVEASELYRGPIDVEGWPQAAEAYCVMEGDCESRLESAMNFSFEGSTHVVQQLSDAHDAKLLL